MVLKPISNIDEYCSRAEPLLGVFSSKKWLSVYDDRLQVIGIYKDENTLIGGFYFLRTSKWGLKFIKLPPYTPHCGLFFISGSKNKSSVTGFSKEIMTEVCNFLNTEKSALCVLAFPSEQIDLQPFIWNKYKVVPNYTYRIDLDRSIEEIKSDFDAKNRNVINKALANIIVSENILNAEQLFDYFSQHLLSAGANVYSKELKNIFTVFANTSNSFSQVALINDKVVGIVFCIYDNKNCYYLLGGVNKDTGVGGINNLLVLKSIERAKSLGCKTFDFEGSMLKGVEKFFRSFGPALVPFFTVNKAMLPLEMVLKFKKRELF